MALREITVDQLMFGMYVSKLDRPWTETPFMFQGFVLKNDKQIDALKKHCKSVFIDPEKAEMPDPGKATAEDIAKIRGSTVYKELASVEAELPRAQKTYANSMVVVKELSRAVEIGNAIDSTRSREAATQITESVVRNPDAMALLTKLQEKSGTTLSRAVEISVMMTIFARFLQLPQEQMEVLGMLGLLQDVGKLKLPTQLATHGPMNAADIELYKTHVDHSVEILSSTPGIHPDLPGLASLHHERFDGSGYPRGLRGPAIALSGLIAGIVDAYDSLTAPQPFGENLPPSTALNIIYKARGKHFHPALVEQFIQCIGVFPVGSVVELNSGEVGIVIAQNMVRRMKPRIMIVKDAKGFLVKPYRMLDLMKDPKVSPDEIYKIQKTLEYDSVKIDPREMFL
jgi:HD-GYP domain-containing protein (c-di-GMP phosphodiesterase class II)